MAHQPHIWTGDIRRVLYTRLVQLFGSSDKWEKSGSPGRGLDSDSTNFARISHRLWEPNPATRSNIKSDSRCRKRRAAAHGNATRKPQSSIRPPLSKRASFVIASCRNLLQPAAPSRLT